MRFLCLGYFDEAKWDAMPEETQKAFMEECLAYDEELKASGHFLRGDALQSVKNAVALQIRNGRVAVTDGPYVETKEHIGGLLTLEARDLNHAIALMSKHPGLRIGPFEIRGLDEEINDLVNSRTAVAKQ